MSTAGLKADNEVRVYDRPTTLSSASRGEGGMREQGDATWKFSTCEIPKSTVGTSLKKLSVRKSSHFCLCRPSVVPSKFSFGTRHLLRHHVPPFTSSHLPLRCPCLLLAASILPLCRHPACVTSVSFFFFFLYFFFTNNSFAFPASPRLAASASPHPATYVPMSRPHITPSVSPRHALSLSYPSASSHRSRVT